MSNIYIYNDDDRYKFVFKECEQSGSLVIEKNDSRSEGGNPVESADVPIEALPTLIAYAQNLLMKGRQ